MINSLISMVLYHVFLLTSQVLLLGTSCDAKNDHLCVASSCGEVRNISFPFRLKDDPKSCGNSKYELACENNRTVIYLYAGRYYVKSISYNLDHDGYVFGAIKVVDDGLQKGNCSSLPHYSIANSNFSLSSNQYHLPYASLPMIFMKCSQPVTSALYINTKPCIDGAYSADTPPSISQMKEYSYAVQSGSDLKVGDIKDSCTITMIALASDISGWKGDQYNGSSRYKDVHNMMSQGFDLTYYTDPSSFLDYSFCLVGFSFGGMFCQLLKPVRVTTVTVAVQTIVNIPFVFVQFIAAKFVLGAPCVLIFLIYKWKRRHRAMDANIEEFLQAHKNFWPIRYSYSDIKKITKNFKHKLGEGGYGSVYRGTLRSGNEIAIKILNKPKSNGQDFISEVATIGRIHHVNVVQLVGYCFDDSKQALMYDFMPNGSLDKHVFSRDDNRFLDHKKLYEISLGVAKGIEYLHRGCDMQILHFDIKPHNILLDQNFTPKISDFGLARLYPANHSIVSLTAARGTLGYMAPELFYKDIGGVSHKADVYSFGMLLMEMAGRRRNVNANIERSSQIYFPLWIYDQLSKEKEVEMEEVEEEREITRKMVIVALWCIQLMPNDRPSISMVLDMLEGDIDRLRLPPKPLLYPSEKPIDDVDIEIELESFSTSSSAPPTSYGYQFRNNNEITESCIV
ncbi:LEAF RUST 10 DISEASE-RESISTANCE LOCUS RECEPTOR-LIKE PROTEIN KINASE-like 2.1 [Syzygium oleosum]|uniref:LEAF RUST 10 DISEASE-RESISTANCE LOCUS RECEPTOR-LIKE PROTEIN KINASE-like 2.1 n=1 Tax=Syzygium oleosum TaxID=219896 RepID=UPI0024BBA7D7|nr:LEAF RUST 10 DISEASE-RESISTANCE LOCUS RECEPTOR-LIKE PROTEIN KINASE-like 2.1 [Syzygium oleosum]